MAKTLDTQKKDYSCASYRLCGKKNKYMTQS